MSEKKNITLVPHGGLSNRLRAIASMVLFAEENYFHLKIIWFVNNELNARFEDLFLPLPLAEIQTATKKEFFTLWRPYKKNLFYPYFYQKAKFDCIIKNLVCREIRFQPGTLKKIIGQSKEIYIHTCYDYDRMADFSKLFIPQPFIMERIKTFITEYFSTHTIGVHIRRTDHKKCIDSSPTELFEKAIEDEILENPDTKVYLASDDLTEKTRLRNRFGSRIITQERSTDRNSLEGMAFAVEEQFLLSRCKKIYASHGSSYSEIAQKFNPSTPITVLKL